MDLNSKIFRFDDICINSDIDLANEISRLILENIPNAKIIYAISPLVSNLSDSLEPDRQRVYPKIYNAFSDYRIFYNSDICGIPNNLHQSAILASHGLVHVDHRLLDKPAQEMSILISCSLVKSKIFVPPFNKWNADTELICSENNIKLVKFEDGWKCAEYNDFSLDHKLWYIHHREFSINSFKTWIKSK